MVYKILHIVAFQITSILQIGVTLTELRRIRSSAVPYERIKSVKSVTKCIE